MTDYFNLEPNEQIVLLEAAARDALSHWDLEGASLDLIKHRENAVYEARIGAFRGALRLHRFGYHSDIELLSELQWMQALAKADIRTPKIIPTSDGRLFVNHLSDSLPAELQIDMFEWIDGRQRGSVEEGVASETNVTDTYTAIGELAARVHNQSAEWQLPPGFARHAWDADGIAGQAPLWGQFWKLESATEVEATLLENARDKVYADLSSIEKSSANYSLIHADFTPENVMVDANGVRLIDFDDAGFGWHLFELATSLYFLKSEPCFDQAKSGLIEGYRRHRALTDEHLELLPLFFLARGLTYVGWVHTRHETETARELSPMILAMACEQAEHYLQN
ncbi:MAG: phosphotransferase [Woeseia sp.]|nr:phosphotransferase [Woeseia sp.]